MNFGVFATAQEAYEDYVRFPAGKTFYENFARWKAIATSCCGDTPMNKYDEGNQGLKQWIDVIEEEIERWWADHFPGSPLSQNTAHLNYVRQSLDVLKERLKRL